MKKHILSVFMCIFGILTSIGGCTQSPVSEVENLPEQESETAEVNSESEPEYVAVPRSRRIRIFLVGDSTVSWHYDTKLYYPRYGYGTQLQNFFLQTARVYDLALSGTSSKNFVQYDNYTKLMEELEEEGYAEDYLIIGFGHNDSAYDDPNRFTDPTKPYTDPESFGYHLYQNYIKMARDRGAVPILCTPIAYASKNNDYTGDFVHDREVGDYRQAILDLAAAENIPVIDLTAITKDRFAELGYEKTIRYFAADVGYGDDGVTPIPLFGTDICHLNIYGARYVAYRLACELQKMEGIGDYIAENIEEPTEEILVPFPYANAQ